MMQLEKVHYYTEKFLVIFLIAVCVTIYFKPAYDKNAFFLCSNVCLAVLLAWRFIIKYDTLNPLPKSLVLVLFLFLLYVSVSALMSDNHYWSFIFLRQYRFLILGGLLFTAPLRDRSRKHILVIIFIAAAIAGLVGIAQSFGLMHMARIERAEGFADNPLIYASILAIVCGLTMLMLLMPKTHMLTSKKDFYFLVVVVFLTFCGVVLSESRGVWIGLLIAPVITLFFHNRRKAFVLLFSFIAVFGVILLFSNVLKQRAVLIVTSVYTEDALGSTGTRFELWKGSLLIFKEHPLLGVGLGDFQSNIEKLIMENKLKKIDTTIHAHNIFLQALATGGIIGLTLMVAFLASLIRWGIKRIQENGGIGGYSIILITVLFMVAGLTETETQNTFFFCASCLVIGLIGPYGASNSNSPLSSALKSS